MNNEKKAINVFVNRNYRLVFFGALVSELGALLYSFAVGFYILEISGNNAFLQGSYLALCGAALLLFTPVGGVLGDRFNKAKIMYVCDYIKGVMIILATVLMMILPSPKAHIVILFILGILGNMVSGIFNPAAGAMLPNIVEPQQLQQANAYFSVKSSMESILGVVLAGVLYAVLPLKVLFPAVGACFIASGISEMLIRYDHTPSAEPMTLRLAVSDLKEGILYLKGQKAIMAIIGAALFINFFFTPVTGNFIPYFIKTDLASAPAYLFDSRGAGGKMRSEGCQKAVLLFGRDDRPGDRILVAGGHGRLPERLFAGFRCRMPRNWFPALLNQHSSQHCRPAQGGKKQAQQDRQHHKRRFTGNDPDRLRIGGGGASGFRQYRASCHLRSRVHDYSSPAFDKQACQITIGCA